MSEDQAAPTKKTATTTTIPAATAVPVGSADDGAKAKDAVTAPRCLVISIVTLDAIALAFWVLTFLLPPLGFIGLACAIVASILACIVPCQDADEEFNHSIKTMMGTHIAFGATYILYPSPSRRRLLPPRPLVQLPLRLPWALQLLCLLYQSHLADYLSGFGLNPFVQDQRRQETLG